LPILLWEHETPNEEVGHLARWDLGPEPTPESPQSRLCIIPSFPREADGALGKVKVTVDEDGVHVRRGQEAADWGLCIVAY